MASERAALDAAGQAVSGLLVDAYADDSLLTPGAVTIVTLEAYNPSRDSLRVRLGVAGAADTTVEVSLAPGARAVLPLALTIPADAEPTAVPQRRASRLAALYEPDGWVGLPADRERVTGLVASVTLLGDGPLGPVERPVTFRWNEQSRGEVRVPVVAVPRVDVTLAPAELPWRSGDRAAHAVHVTLHHAAHDTTRGSVRLELPGGWPPVAPQRFSLAGEGAVQELDFAVRAPAAIAEGGLDVRAIVQDEAGRTYDIGRQLVSYPHIRPRSAYHPAVARVTAVDLALPARRRIGYVRGAADAVPEALLAAGFPVEVIAPGAIGRGDLSRYDAIVLGPRAYETDAALTEVTPRLLAWVRAGGLLLVQYQQYAFFLGGYAPDRLAVWARVPGRADGGQAMGPGVAPPFSSSLLGGHDRVTDERATVTPLRPEDPVLRVPNRIGPADWEGWVQERGLYFAREWGPGFRPVLAMADPGEPAREGGLLVMHVGKGAYVYTGLSFFRQLPAGVPGAFRLFANLLAVQ